MGTVATVPATDRLLIVTAVWGEWHIDMYLNLNLPTLLENQ